MTKLLTATAVALLLGVGPALAADDPDLSDQSGAIPEAQESVPADEDASSAKSEDEAQPEAAAPQE